MSKSLSPVITIAGADAAVLAETDLLQLSCGISGCDSNCCKASAPIVLNPYEIALICREGAMSYEDLLDIVDTDRANGFPLVMLPTEPRPATSGQSRGAASIMPGRWRAGSFPSVACTMVCNQGLSCPAEISARVSRLFPQEP